MTHESWQQEEFSIAYVTAVASVAGYATQRHDVDQDGIDLSIHAHGGGGAVRSPRVEAQVKSQTAGKPPGFPWSYPLKAGNYENLRHSDFLVPRILIVVAMPKDVANWAKHTPTQLALRHCAYWVSLRGQPASPNQKTVTVYLPRKDKFSPTELDKMMKRIGQKGLP